MNTAGPQRTAAWRALLLPAALHVALCLGIYQYGFSDREMQTLQIAGPSRLIDPYLTALRLYGPSGVVRTYLRGEQDERLYLEYARLLLLGKVDLAYVAKRQNDPSLLKPLPPRPWPYRDVRVEYPPLAYAATLPPALISFDYRPYRYAFAGYMLLLHALNVWLCTRLLRAQPETTARIAWGSLAFCAALGTVFVTRMDHVVVTSTLLVVWAFDRTQHSLGAARLRWAAACGAFTALGVLVKLVPGLAGAAAVVLWLRSGVSDRWRLSAVCVAVGALVFVAVNLVVYQLAGPNYAGTFRYHALRGVQLESTYAGLIMLLRPLGFAMRIDESFGSTNLASAATPLVKLFSTCLLLAGTAYLLGLRRFAADARGALLLICALLLTFMLTNRVFSPQYLIWIAAPLCVLYAENTVTKRGYIVFIACVFLSQLIFPRGYPLLKAFHPLGIFLLDLRNISLIAFGIGLVRKHSTAVLFAKSSA
ncbi:MAG TPA: hypothetical protein VFN67_37250 [Polyangiales bacterium]|nr:hypothetical protein [Polyangiales bacterium]